MISARQFTNLTSLPLNYLSTMRKTDFQLRAKTMGRINLTYSHFSFHLVNTRQYVLTCQNKKYDEKMPGEKSCLIIMQQFEPVRPEELDRFLSTVSSATCFLDPYLTLFGKVAWEISCEWVLVKVDSFLGEGIVLLSLKKALVHASSRNHHWIPSYWTIPSLSWGGWWRKWLCNSFRGLGKVDYSDAFQSGKEG